MSALTEVPIRRRSLGHKWLTTGCREGFMQVRIMLAVGVVLLLLGGCSGERHSDLEEYINDVKSQKKVRIEPLPEFKPFETYSYRSEGLNDPYKPWATKASLAETGSGANQGPRPDPRRNKGPLEEFPLDSLNMVGTLEQRAEFWAIIQAPDKLVYRVREGHYIGQNHGKIVAVADNAIELVEIIPNGLGGWQERQASVTLAEQ